MDLGITQLFRRIQTYFETEPAQVLVELAIIWLVIYTVVNFLRGTRGAGLVKGVALLLAVGTLLLLVLGRVAGLERLDILYDKFLTIVGLILIVVFQPELRRALTRLGEASFFRQVGLRKARVIEELLGAVDYLSRNKIGALVAIERQVGLKNVIEAGTRLDAEVSKELLNTVFWPGSALHDMGLVIRGDRAMAAGCQFPLADSQGLPQELGSRHRAAIGLSQECDALIVVVSEETGAVSVAERGVLNRKVGLDDLRTILSRGLTQVTLANDRPTDAPGSLSPGSLSPEILSPESVSPEILPSDSPPPPRKLTRPES